MPGCHAAPSRQYAQGPYLPRHQREYHHLATLLSDALDQRGQRFSQVTAHQARKLIGGASIADVKEILGHSSIAITAAIYLHSYEDTKREAVAGAAQLLRTWKVV